MTAVDPDDVALIGEPEYDARRLLVAAMREAFLDDVAVLVCDGPPPDLPEEPHVVWIGRFDTDANPSSLRGSHGPSDDVDFVVEVTIDATVEDPSPDGAPDAELQAARRLAKIRRAVEEQRRRHARSKAAPGATYTTLRWVGVTRATSTGPLPLDGAHGWSSTITCDVGFHARQRSTPA